MNSVPELVLIVYKHTSVGTCEHTIDKSKQKQPAYKQNL